MFKLTLIAVLCISFFYQIQDETSELAELQQQLDLANKTLGGDNSTSTTTTTTKRHLLLIMPLFCFIF